MCCSPWYSTVRGVAFATLYVLEGWNEADRYNNTFIVCVVFEAVCIAILTFNACSTVILKRYEGWALKVLGTTKKGRQLEPVRIEDANAAITQWKHYGEPFGTYISLFFSIVCIICFIVKLSGYSGLFSYAR